MRPVFLSLHQRPKATMGIRGNRPGNNDRLGLDFDICAWEPFEMKLRQANLTRSSSLYWLLGVHCKIRTSAARWSPTDRRSSGFTLIELLVALIVGAIITTLVLGFTVSLMRNNQREASRSNTQREVQAAIDYINRDVREAVYVYDGDCLRTTGVKSSGNPATPANTCPGLLKYLPTQLNATDNLPVLAFWRLDPLPAQLLANICGNAGNAKAIVEKTAAPAIAAVPCGARKMYTLVVYSLNRSNPGTWSGRSRITRYTLSPYTDASGTNQTPGWYSPLVTGFPTWPYNPVTNALPAGPAGNWAGNNQTLVDFVDDRTNDQGAANAPAVCPTVNNVAQDTPGGFYASPAQSGAGGYGDTTTSRRIFYACVRGGDAASLNQEVIVRIQGNAAGQPGVPLNNGSVPITMETRILTRGVLEKS
jgi:prepilin-type N-terminal cleavage/methylation domain-containing protein